MPFSHGKDGGVCVFVCFLRHRMFSHHPVGEGLAPPCLVSEAFILRGGFRPAGDLLARGGEGGKTPPGVSRGRLTAPAEPLPDPVYGGYPYTLPQKFRPAVAEGAESGGAGRSRFYKQRAGGSGIRPYGGFGELQKRTTGGRAPPYGVSGKESRTGAAQGNKRTKPQNIQGFVLFILIARVCALLSPAHTPAGRPAPPWTWGE